MERRRYFRVTDQVRVALSEAEKIGQASNIALPVERERQELEQQFSEAMIQVRAQSSDVAKALDVLNSKLNFLINLELEPEQAGLLKEVSLSACGMGLPINEADFENLSFSTNQILKMSLTLLPANSLISLECRVVAIEENQFLNTDQYSHFLRLDFESIGDQDMEVLIQHLVLRQSQQLQQKMKQQQQEEFPPANPPNGQDAEGDLEAKSNLSPSIP